MAIFLSDIIEFNVKSLKWNQESSSLLTSHSQIIFYLLRHYTNIVSKPIKQ